MTLGGHSGGDNNPIYSLYMNDLRDPRATSEMEVPPDGLVEDATQVASSPSQSQPPQQSPRNHPHTSLSSSPAQVQLQLQSDPKTSPRVPLVSSRSSFVFNSSASQDWARESSVDRGRPTLSTFPSFASSDSVQTTRSASSEQLLPHGSNWQRPRAYQTRLTAGDFFAHAFGDTTQTREWKRSRTVARVSSGPPPGDNHCTTPVKEVAASDVSPVHNSSNGLPAVGNAEPSSPPATLTRRRSSGLIMVFKLSQKVDGCYTAPPKGAFRSSSSRPVERRHSQLDLASPLPPSESSTSIPSPSSSSSLSLLSSSPFTSPPESFATLYSSFSEKPAVSRERLLTREEWKKKASERQVERRRSRQGHSPSSDSSGGSVADHYPLYTNPEPLMISSQYVGGCIGLEAAPPADIRRHPSLSRRNSQSHPHPNACCRSLSLNPPSPRIPLGKDAHEHDKGNLPSNLSAGTLKEDVDVAVTMNDRDDEVASALRRLEIISQLALSMRGLEEEHSLTDMLAPSGT